MAISRVPPAACTKLPVRVRVPGFNDPAVLPGVPTASVPPLVTVAKVQLSAAVTSPEDAMVRVLFGAIIGEPEVQLCAPLNTKVLAVVPALMVP